MVYSSKLNLETKLTDEPRLEIYIKSFNQGIEIWGLGKFSSFNPKTMTLLKLLEKEDEKKLW
jgi:hypothetical protein